MRGGITLDSILGQGTTASFWIPFNKRQYVSDKSRVADVKVLSERLQSELSISGCDSDPERVRHTPPQSPMEAGVAKSKSPFPPPRPSPIPIQRPNEGTIDATERKNIHVLVVEDKYGLPLFKGCTGC